MNYKITITNNETGEILMDNENAVAIVGAITDEEKTMEIGFINCNALNLAGAVIGAESVISQIKRESPEVEVLLQLKEIMEKMKKYI